GTWVGSLTALEGGKGYWMILDEDITLTFENGCDEQECATLSRIAKQPVLIPEGYEFAQSTEQAFYFLEDIENIEVGDWILAYNGDVVVGARQWMGSIIDIPTMGSDGNSYSSDYMEAGDTPTFKLLSGSKLTTLEGDVPAFENNQLYMVASLTEAVAFPEAFSLDRAYPNPFNPTTTLSFSIPVDSEVILSIYNLQGRQVSTLVNGNMAAGYHSVVWNADRYSSGVYIVKMMTSEFTKTQKLMLMK
ncbi:MAG: T9SS type A sorting domain-containing protein, partial [Candidatus Marinimicrobia bacterium]|nr:T9SS type A sorting domain-containing protein [Candidatus Neomarinimicrobiota bacterium]